MKVYVKKEDKNSIIPGIILTIMFLLFSIGMVISVIKSGKSFIEVLVSYGIVLLFAIVFLGFGLYFIYALIKSPKGYKVKLVNKMVEIYKGKQITYMAFNTRKGKKEKYSFNSADYRCYTIGENDLIIGNDYSLRIKEFNWEPKYVEKVNNSCESETIKVASNFHNKTLSPIFLIIGLFFGGLFFLCILGIVTYPRYVSTYINVCIFCSMALFLAINEYKLLKTINIEQDDEDLESEFINNNQIKKENIKKNKVKRKNKNSY